MDSQDSCILCHIHRPIHPPRIPDRPPVCEGSRLWLERVIASIGLLHHRLVNADAETAGSYVGRDDNGRRIWQGLTAGPVPGRTNQPHVSGGRRQRLPIDVDEFDLAAAARRPNPTSEARQYPADQVGRLSVATVLWEMVTDWRDTLWPDQHLPEPTVPTLVAWLRAGATLNPVSVRIDEACDRHPAIVDNAVELSELRHVLRGHLGESELPPRRWLGVPCARCKEISQLSQQPGDVWIECEACGCLYSEAELREHMRAEVNGPGRSRLVPAVKDA